MYKQHDVLPSSRITAIQELFGPMQETLHKDISFAENAVTRLFIQQWQPTNYARAAGALVLQEIYQSPANRVVPII